MPPVSKGAGGFLFLPSPALVEAVGDPAAETAGAGGNNGNNPQPAAPSGNPVELRPPRGIDRKTGRDPSPMAARDTDRKPLVSGASPQDWEQFGNTQAA